MHAPVELHALHGLPPVRPGDDLAALTLAALDRQRLTLRDADVLVFAQKIVSKAEGRLVDLTGVTPSQRAQDLAVAVAKDARLVELILRESVRVVRHRVNVLIVEHRLGFVMANAGIDQSNVDQSGAEMALLLPENPDASAEALRADLTLRSGAAVGVVINDSFGRPWRRGAVGVAIGCAGVAALRDLRGAPDLFGRKLRVTDVGAADEIASAASMVMGQAGEGLPVVLVRGLAPTGPAQPAQALVRARQEDLFR
jgi:coenzyme F420-0:L-glutamate ligase/coenzyme F420-1:gamma-L-glutamate ligase